jgi:hypothetical protein
MQTIPEETQQHAIEAADTEGALPAITHSRSSSEEPTTIEPKTEEDRDGNTVEVIDDKHAPAIFSNVLTEFLSILTLAFAPGLNVIPPCCGHLIEGDECRECQHCTSFDWTGLVH